MSDKQQPTILAFARDVESLLAEDDVSGVLDGRNVDHEREVISRSVEFPLPGSSIQSWDTSTPSLEVAARFTTG